MGCERNFEVKSAQPEEWPEGNLKADGVMGKEMVQRTAA